MKTRSQILKQIENREKKIKSLRAEISELERKNLLFSDKNQWFVEKEEEVIVSRRPKKIETKLVGRVFWNEGFLDEDTGEVVTMTRNMIVRKNNHWI